MAHILSPKGISWGTQLPHTQCCTSTSLEANPWVLTPTTSMKWKISVFMMPATSRGLASWGRLLILGGWLVVFTESEIFPGFDLFATGCFHSQLIVETDIFSPVKYDTQQQWFAHWGFYSPQGKSTFKYDVGSSWCPALLPLKSTGDLPATSVGEGADMYFVWQKFLYNSKKKKKAKICTRLHDTVLLGEQNWPPTPLSCLSLGRDAPHFKCAIVQSYTNLVLIPLVLMQIAYIRNANW